VTKNALRGGAIDIELDENVAVVLTRLHELAGKDAERPRTGGDDLIRMGEIYMAISKTEGRFLYSLARIRNAKRVVEFGASFGVSTLYLGAAARANGGQLVTTEVHPEKCENLRRTIREAGLDSVVTLLEGDARETLPTAIDHADFLFLDGWKSMYLPVFELLEPKLEDRAVIVADNIDHEGCKDYVAHVRDVRSGLVSNTFDKMEFSFVDRLVQANSRPL
jgi:predicted O-methyltransferase YrrM